METKLVYSVVSRKGGLYLPQALASMFTARRFNPIAHIALITDEETADVIDEDFPVVQKYIDEIVIVDIPSALNQKQKSRYLKTSLRQNIRGDFLFIDADTVITCDLSEIDNISGDFAAVLDRHSLMSDHPIKESVMSDLLDVGIIDVKEINNKYYNSGVLYVKDSHRAYKLFERWHENWLQYKDVKSIDQPVLALSIKQLNFSVHELDGVWNCQVFDGFLKFLSEAKIIHYYGSNKSNAYKLSEKEVLRGILENGNIPDDLLTHLENPKSFFSDKHKIIYGEDLSYINSIIHDVFLYRKGLYKFFEFVCKCCSRKFWHDLVCGEK